jgi:hypothetical protein
MAEQGRTQAPSNMPDLLWLFVSIQMPTGFVAKQLLHSANCAWELGMQDALALDGQFGILEGRIFSLIHPVVMGTLLLATGWAGYLGWQWRRVRTIQDEINALKKQVPATVEGQAVPSPVQTQINELTEVRNIHTLDIIRQYFLRKIFENVKNTHCNSEDQMQVIDYV